jgi:dihydrofolate reductase
MRKVILSIMTSLDMQIARADGNLDWFLTDVELENEMLGVLRSVDAMIFGRVAYQLLAQFWPTAGTTSDTAPGGFATRENELEFARLMNSIPKIVYSRSLKRADWGPVTLRKEVSADEIARERQAPGKDLVVFAGANIASAFVKQDLVDEYRLMVHPRLVGNGIPLFQGLSAEHELKLQRATTFPCGVVLLQYSRSR